jgi:hypothetical protein
VSKSLSSLPARTSSLSSTAPPSSLTAPNGDSSDDDKVTSPVYSAPRRAYVAEELPAVREPIALLRPLASHEPPPIVPTASASPLTVDTNTPAAEYTDDGITSPIEQQPPLSTGRRRSQLSVSFDSNSNSGASEAVDRPSGGSDQSAVSARYSTTLETVVETTPSSFSQRTRASPPLNTSAAIPLNSNMTEEMLQRIVHTMTVTNNDEKR